MTDVPEELAVDESGEHGFPVMDVLAGRGFITGKSGSGKSNTASVVAEELLDAGLPLLVVDVDGEYYGLKERYELLHVGGDETCDLRVGPGHADRLAELALAENVPIVLDVSGFVDEGEARDLVAAVVRSLFTREKTARKPFLLLVEEVHEYLPESKGLDEAGEMLVRVAKRGRKRGLGLVGISQRPAAVDKEFITQCDWLVFHRLTWQNDTQVVRSVLGGEYASQVEDLADGEALVRADWDDRVRRIRFRRKHTFDAGATPDLGDIERPELKSVDDALVAELREASGEGGDAPADADAERLREQLAEKEAYVAELEARIEELERKRGRGDGGANADPPAGEDPVWEAGQLIAHGVGSVWRGLKRPFRSERAGASTAGGESPEPDTDRDGTSPE